MTLCSRCEERPRHKGRGYCLPCKRNYERGYYRAHHPNARKPAMSPTERADRVTQHNRERRRQRRDGIAEVVKLESGDAPRCGRE